MLCGSAVWHQTHLQAAHLVPACRRVQAQQALSVALNKVGELKHLTGDLAAAAEQYAAALALRRALLAATRRQWPQPQERGAAGGGSGGEPAAQPGEGEEACCSAALDLAASCLKLAGARQGLGAAEEAEVRRGGWCPQCSGRGMPCSCSAAKRARLPQQFAGAAGGGRGGAEPAGGRPGGPAATPAAQARQPASVRGGAAAAAAAVRRPWQQWRRQRRAVCRQPAGISA